MRPSYILNVLLLKLHVYAGEVLDVWRDSNQLGGHVRVTIPIDLLDPTCHLCKWYICLADLLARGAMYET